MLNAFIFIVLPSCSGRCSYCDSVPILLKPAHVVGLFHAVFWSRKPSTGGSNPWHYGIIRLLIAHLVSVIAPGPMRAILGNSEP